MLRKMCTTAIAAAGIGLLLGASDAGAQKIRVPHATRTTLANGLTVIVMPYTKVPVVHLRLVVRGGSAQDPEGLEGTASIMTSLMREGTTSRTGREIAEQIDFIGGTLYCGAGLDYCAVRCEVLGKDLTTGLDLFADIVMHPAFPADELDREIKQRRAELEGLKEDPEALANRAFVSHVYGDHAYGRSATGTRASLDEITRASVRDFYESVFTPSRSTLVLVGDVDPADAMEKLTAAFGGWAGEADSLPAVPAPVRRTGRTVILVDKPDATQTQVIIGNTGVDRRNPDCDAIDVANTIFGGAFTSRLVDVLRVQRSLTYVVGSGFGTHLAGGLFAIATFTKNETVREIIDGILEQLRLFRSKGATAMELVKGRNYLAGEFARGLQSPQALAGDITDIELFGLPPTWLETHIQKLQGVTLENVRHVAGKYFPRDEDMVVVVVGPAADLAPVLASYGDVTTLTLDDVVR